MYSVINELCYKGTILQRKDRKMTVSLSFSYNTFAKFLGNKFGCESMCTKFWLTA